MNIIRFDSFSFGLMNRMISILRGIYIYNKRIKRGRDVNKNTTSKDR